MNTHCYRTCNSDTDCRGDSVCLADGNGNDICTESCTATGEECRLDEDCDVANSICLRSRELTLSGCAGLVSHSEVLYIHSIHGVHAAVRLRHRRGVHGGLLHHEERRFALTQKNKLQF